MSTKFSIPHWGSSTIGKPSTNQRYAAGLSVIPPDAKQAIFATQLDLAEMAPQWESSVMRLNADADLPNLARMSGGKLEMIGNDKAVALPPDAYAVQFSPTLVGAIAPADRQYFKRVAGYIADLHSSSGDAATMGSIALWYDSYARKVDELPVVGVDPELIAYGQRMSAAMRQASELIRGDNAESAVRQATPNRLHVTETRSFANQYSYGWRRYGAHRYDAPAAPYRTATNRYVLEHDSPRAIRTQETAKAGLSSSEIMQQIDADTAAVRKAMSLKYNENF